MEGKGENQPGRVTVCEAGGHGVGGKSWREGVEVAGADLTAPLSVPVHRLQSHPSFPLQHSLMQGSPTSVLGSSLIHNTPA